MAESADLGYRYSGSDMIVEPFHATVLNLKVLSHAFSVCLHVQRLDFPPCNLQVIRL